MRVLLDLGSQRGSYDLQVEATGMGSALSAIGDEPGAPKLNGKTPYVDGLSPQEYFDEKVWPALEDIWGAFNSEQVSGILHRVSRTAPGATAG